ncbi:MAG: SpoIVB peptidase S55 domain protein, partial [Selenomonadaceae bacterium]|nr:SpoIVB peptidase S55 domain protein [Selenomonadaceae bacterium]
DKDKDKDKDKSKSEKVDKKSKNDKSDKKSDKKSDNKSKTDKKSKSDKSKKKDQPVKKDEPVEDKLPVETPKPESKNSSLFVDGFDSRGLQFLSNELGLKELLISNSTTGKSNVNYNATLEPGSAVGVAIICGDFSVGAIGTITAVDGKKILGFGHSFTHTGNVNFFMTDASVIGTISGANGLGVKIANVGNIIGRINQDRDTGVAGIIGKFPSVVPINVKITDKVLGKSETYNSLMAYNETFIPKLGAAIAYTALSRTTDSLSESTVDVNFSIKTNAISSGKIERKNTFYNATDVGQVAVIELLQALNLVCSNTTQESDIFSIDVDMTFDNERRTASLVSAVPNKTKVKPGETIELNVTLQPYRKKNETLKISYTVPVTMKEGPLTLDLHGGALIPVSQALANSGLITSTENNDAAKNYNDKINELINSGRNNQIVVEPGGVAEPKSDRELKREIARAKKAQEKALKAGKKANTPKETKVDTNYIIDNVIHTTIEVEKI